MPSDADYAAMAYGNGDRSPRVVRLVEQSIREEQEESQVRKDLAEAVTPGYAVPFTDTTLKFEPWIQTVTGKKFYYLAVNAVDEVDIVDIATALSRMPRWAGHTTAYYSVAQHSVCVAHKVSELGGDTQEALLGLLHDATEAYMCDIPKPLKLLCPEFAEIEHKVWRKISRAFFGEVVPIVGLVHEVDGAMLATEARDLFPFEPIDNWVRRCPPPYPEKIKPLGPKASLTLFMKVYRELTDD